MIRYNIVEVSDSANDNLCTLAFDSSVDRQTIETNVTDMFAEGFFGSDETLGLDLEGLTAGNVNVVDVNSDDATDVTPTEIRCHVMLIEDDNTLTFSQDEYFSAIVDSDSDLYYKTALGKNTSRIIEEYDFVTSSLNMNSEFI